MSLRCVSARSCCVYIDFVSCVVSSYANYRELWRKRVGELLQGITGSCCGEEKQRSAVATKAPNYCVRVECSTGDSREILCFCDREGRSAHAEG